ncbi:phenylacetic acid degradation bifunctional protein PaaZ [Exilibacterium tricleocarpae]|uniref:Phenylacetic acid degradation bifunctional protein PaaZ n=1 Tax=Exilibacterium tricleocarpae TaxID=2591008 RepID=A0A545SP24_9GAMM|nr:phenylacetic acid degradation bifunctional protein PaaZ [Exilibacterium tricleocarpae]TQV66732.1 phenylacetic acid degradation bifunctional protein PaaZ [Exilibacterium tricleocarpae]
MKVQSYVAGQWVEGAGQGVQLVNAVNGEPIAEAGSRGIDFKAVLDYARDTGGPALRALTFHERAARLKALGKLLLAQKEELYRISAWTGATRTDSWIDIDGGAGTLFTYSSLVRREFPNDTVLVEGEMEHLSKSGSFVGRHILTAKPGVALHINAYNFPCWGMLEKMAPSLAAGMPVVVKPATVSCYLTAAMVRMIIDAGVFPEGAIQLICGSAGDLLDHVTEQDVVTFTGSAATGRQLRTHPAIVDNAVPFNMEADSLNCAILGRAAAPGTPEFDLYVREVAKEMTVKAGQKCTAIRRAIVPADYVDAVQEALAGRLDKVVVGDPDREGVRMGALVGKDQREDVWEAVATLQASAAVVYGGRREFEVLDASAQQGAFFQPTLLRCDKPLASTAVHAVEAFGPVSTLMPYSTAADAVELARLGRGSLVGSVVTPDNGEARAIVLGAAAYHGRLLILNADCAAESTGHGSPLPALVHGGPGRAGGGEELGGLRAVKHYMQRTALQGSPTTLTAITGEYHRGGATVSTDVHPFRKYFDDLQIGETLVTHRRTVTEADIVNFGCLSGDHFYAHFDELAAQDSLFGKRVAHGYFVISAAAGMFVEPSVGPVLANYGLDNLRFVEPVGIGDTIRVAITVKRKVKKDKRPDEARATGVVVWAVEVSNQNDEPVALYDILTLVEIKSN